MQARHLLLQRHSQSGNVMQKIVKREGCSIATTNRVLIGHPGKEVIIANPGHLLPDGLDLIPADHVPLLPFGLNQSIGKNVNLPVPIYKSTHGKYDHDDGKHKEINGET